MKITLTHINPSSPIASTEMASALKEKQYLNIPKVGDVVRGRVLSVNKSEVHLDIAGYTSGVIRGAELYNESEEYSKLKVGDEIDATVVDLENELGEIELSFRSAGHAKTWNKLAELMNSGQVVEVEVLDATKGGLLVTMGHLAGFLPVSQLNADHYPRVPGGDKTKILEKLKPLVGQKLIVKVLDVNSEEEKLIVSEKKISDDAQVEKVAGFRVGQTVEGPITAVTDFGAFLQFSEGLTGLIHISELAWQRVEKPTDVIAIGDHVSAEIINIDGAKVFLSRKRLLPDPWKTAAEKYNVGQTVSGKILKINPFGLFVEVDPEIHGLAHVSEMDSETLSAAKLGDTMEFRIVSLQPNEHRLGLSLKKGGENDAPVKAVAKESSKEESAPAQPAI